MPTCHRTLVVPLATLGLLLMLVLPSVEAAETIGLSKDVTLVSQTLDGTVLDGSAALSSTTTVNVLLQRCTVQGAGLTVRYANSTWTATTTPIIVRILDINVMDATLAFRDSITSLSDARIVNVTASMAGSTPLFDLRNFYLRAGTGSSMTIQRVRATWGSGGGGSVVQVGGSGGFSTQVSQTFSFSEAVITGAAHMLEITPECTSSAGCYSVSRGLNAFDLIEYRDARGAFLYSNTDEKTLVSDSYGMIRFSNITMTGGQPFFEARDGTRPAMYNGWNGNIVFSAISNDGPLFSLVPGADISAQSSDAKYTFRHINVASVMSDPTSYTATVPTRNSTDSYKTRYVYMGNITVAGKLMNTIDELESNQLYATQLVGAYGEVIQVRQSGNWPQPSLGTAATVNCVGAPGGTAEFVELVPGVNRAECNCPSSYYTPYCTSAVDPLVYYDAYIPSPAVCRVAKCDTCLFGQARQCGACAFGYGLTAALECDIIECIVPGCTSCQKGSATACTQCAAGYTFSSTQSTCIPCHIPACNGCTVESVCDSCASGYKLNDKGVCKKNGVGWWVWLIVGIAAAAVVAGVVVLAVCCVCHRRRREAEASECDASTGAGGMLRTAWGVPIAMDATRPDPSLPTAAQRARSDDRKKVRTAWVSPAIIDDPPAQSTHSASHHGRSADCHAVRAAQEAETIVANPLDDTYRYPFEGYKEEVRSPSRDETSDVDSRVEHAVALSSTRHRDGKASSQDAT